MELSYNPNSSKKRSKFSERINIIEFLELSRLPFDKETPTIIVGGLFGTAGIIEYSGLVYLRYEFSDLIEFNDCKTKFEASPHVLGFTSENLSNEQIDLFVINLFVQCDINKCGFVGYESFYETKLYPHCAKLLLKIAVPDAEFCKCTDKVNHCYDLNVYVNYDNKPVELEPNIKELNAVLSLEQKEQVQILEHITKFLARQALSISDLKEDLEVIACALFANFDYNIAHIHLTNLVKYSYEKVDIKPILAGAIDTINETKNPKKKFTFGKILEFAKLLGWVKPLTNELKSILVRNSKGDATIGTAEFLIYLELNGFATYMYDDQLTFIKYANNICNSVSVDQIQAFVSLEIRKSESRLLATLFTSSVKKLIDIKLLKNLINIGGIGLPTSPDFSYLPFENVVVRISKQGNSIIEYSKLSFKIWDKDVIKHKFNGFDNGFRIGDFAKFIANVSGGGYFQKCFEGAIGYLCTGYKDVSITKMITLTDYAIARSKEDANGGTGKSIFIEAIKHTVPSVLLPSLEKGKQFDFQGISIYHKVAYFGDADPEFHFKALFDMITNDMRTEKKHQNAIIIPFAKSPKFMLATNHTIKNMSESAQRRLYTLEFREYYSKSFSPMDEFGKRIFTDWNASDWDLFYNYIINCIGLFITKGLPELVAQNAFNRQLQDLTCAEFVEFAGELEPNKIYECDSLFEDFNNRYPEVSESVRGGLNRSMFGKWLNRKCSLSGWVFEKKSKMELGVTIRTYFFKKK